jgi:hypothetical protein
MTQQNPLVDLLRRCTRSPDRRRTAWAAVWPLVVAPDLGPFPLQDLRPGQASLMLVAGVPMAIVSKRLGHSSLAITSDTYAHLLEGVGQQAASATAALVPRADRRTRNEPRSPEDALEAGLAEARPWVPRAGSNRASPQVTQQRPGPKTEPLHTYAA